jgi:hypothetical protein
MTLSVKNRKILWARSGNVCGFPGCDQALVEHLGGNAMNTVLGEEAHILPRSPVGPRGTGVVQSTESALNYILFCPTHHRVVDERPNIYHEHALRAMKEAHESHVRALIASQLQSNQLVAAGYHEVCDTNRAVNAWRSGESAAIVCSFGSDPTPLPVDHWRAVGVQFVSRTTGGATEVLYVSTEADFDVEYWADGPVLHGVQHTYDPETQWIVPLIEHQFSFNQCPARRAGRVLLVAPLLSSGEIAALRTALSTATGPEHAADCEIALFRVRNLGVRCAEQAGELLDFFRSRPWCDGALSEVATSIARELSQVALLKGAT